MNEEFVINDKAGGHFERARVLMDQERHELAERELRHYLLAEPDDASAHSMLAMCLARQKKFRAATEAARRAVALAPAFPYAHYALAWVFYHADRPKEAETAVNEAIRLDPENADYFELLSGVRIQRRRWREALDAAERGLYFDSEHVGCINLRAMALNQMGLSDDAAVAVEGALSVEPENAFTHANRGWQQVHRGDYQRAMEHFREALRIDAQCEWARQGVVEVLKARNPIYRVMLRYFLWSSRLSGRALWIFLIGFFFLPRVFNTITRTYPDLAPFVWPLHILYMAFVLMTWIADPLFNLLLRLDPVGRVALTRKQIVASNAVGIGLLLALVSLVLAVAAISTPYSLPFFLLAAGALMMTVPVAGAFHAETHRARTVLPRYAVALGVLALVTFALSFYDFETAMIPGTLFLLGFFLYGWVANALTIKT